MRRVAKITVSIPIGLLEVVERYRNETNESRSEAVTHLLESALRRERERADVERYVRGYLQEPETEEEMAISDHLASEAAASDPWP